MYKIGRFILLLFMPIFLSQCTSDVQVQNTFHIRVKGIQKQLIPDPAMDLLQVELKKENRTWVLQGYTTLLAAREAVTELTDSLLGMSHYINRFTLLPDPALRDSTFGITKLSVAPVRKEPKHRSEMVDQVILGSTVQLLLQKKGWYLIKTEYGYMGWSSNYSFQRTDSKGLNLWKREPRVRVKALWGEVLEQPNENALPLSDLVLNATLHLVRSSKEWTQVTLPNGQNGYVRSTILTPYTGPIPIEEVKSSAIIHTARRLLGIPYLWGGNSSKGSDCSGFTQTVFKAHGIQLPRDARQQALLGKQIVPDPHFSNVLPGDLLFFGSQGRITHVGMSLGGYAFIHQDSEVHIDSFDPKAPNFNAFRLKHLRKIMRILKYKE